MTQIRCIPVRRILRSRERHCEAQLRRQRGKGPLPRFTEVHAAPTPFRAPTRASLTRGGAPRPVALRRDGGTSVPDERASGRLCTGTRLPGAHNYRAR